MFSLPSLSGRSYWVVAGAVGLYSTLLVAFISPWVQRQALYAHFVCSPSWWLDLGKPEQVGFAPNQVSSFTLSTSDNETLYAWHILPLDVYRKHRIGIIAQSPNLPDIHARRSFQLLTDDPQARLVISFHGNAGSVAQSYRPDLYRSITGGSSSNVHVLAIDYRGYGLSSGTPNEQGLVIDGIAAVDWALNVAKISPDRIVIVGHSLGTAVTAAVADYFATKSIDFAGIVLVSGFADLVTLLTSYPSYSIGGFLPVGPLLAPFRPQHISEKWPSADRIASAVSGSRKFRLHLIHAVNDWEIPFHHSDLLFRAAANATTDGLTVDQWEDKKKHKTIVTTHGGSVSTWISGDKIIQQELIPYGGHNEIMTSSSVALAIFTAFDASE